MADEASQRGWAGVMGFGKEARPGLPRESRLELTLKALMVIGDLSDQVQAAVVVGLIAEQEPPENDLEGKDLTANVEVSLRWSKQMVDVSSVGEPRLSVNGE